MNIFAKGDIYKNKLKFEHAASLDILEAKSGLNPTSVVKSELMAIKAEHKERPLEIPLDSKIRYHQLKLSVTEAIKHPLNSSRKESSTLETI